MRGLAGDMEEAEEKAPAARRAPQKKLTQEEQDEIMDILGRPEVDGDFTICERLTGQTYSAIFHLVTKRVTETLRSQAVAGNAAMAAEILKLPYRKVMAIANKDPWLKAQLPEAPVENMLPGETDIINRKDVRRMGAALLGEAKEEYDALAKQNKLMSAEDWAQLGVTLEQGENLIMAEKRAALPLGRMINVIQGQLMGSTAQVEDMLKRIGDRLVNGDNSKYGGFPVEFDANGNKKNTERQWLLAYYGGVDRILAMHGSMLKARTSMFDAQKKMKELLEAKDPLKGEFGGKPLRRAEPAKNKSPTVDGETQ